MRMSGIDDWGLGLTLVFALAFTVTIHQVHHARPTEAFSVAQSDQEPHFVMTITAKRLPSLCKGAAGAANALYCATFLEADAVVEMHETTTGFAARSGAIDADLAYNK